MEVLQYLQLCNEYQDTSELLLSWHYAGAEVCNSLTKFYKKGSAYLINAENSKFNNYLLLCQENYTGQIGWENINSLDEAKQTTLSKGLTAECFTFIDTPIKKDDLKTLLENNPDYIPFVKYSQEGSSNTDIIIDDDTYYQIMKVVGVPFVKERELEYNRQAILKLAVEPALRLYYTYFPIKQEQVIPGMTTGDYMIPYPTEPYPAYKAVAWKTSAGPLGGAAAINGLSPLAALGTDISLYTRSAAGGNFNTGLTYNKPVPGYTGRGSGTGGSVYSELATAWPIANTLKNIMRREKLSKIRVPGKGLFAKGYSTVSGFLNIIWLCWSRNFDDVDFDDWHKVIELCQAEVKVSIGAIRELLRTDSNIPFKEGMQKEGEETIKSIEKEWSEQSYNKSLTPMRGGVL